MVYELDDVNAPIVKRKRRALKGYAQSYEITVGENAKDPMEYLNNVRQEIVEILSRDLRKMKGIKFNELS